MPSGILSDTSTEVRDTCLCLHVQRAARTLARRLDQALRPLGLTNVQFSMLALVNKREPARGLEALATQLGMDRVTFTLDLRTLERLGLITVAIEPRSRNTRLVKLTEQGQSVLADAIPIWRAIQAAVEAELDGFEPSKLRSALNTLST